MPQRILPPPAPAPEAVDQQMQQLLGGENPDLTPVITPGPDFGYGPRWGRNDPKGLGYFGNFELPNGQGVMGEYSRGDTIGGRVVEYPLIVPDDTEEELRAVMGNAERPWERLPDSVERKAHQHATERLRQGRDPFAQVGEQRTDRHPGLKRAPLPSPAGLEETNDRYGLLAAGLDPTVMRK